MYGIGKDLLDAKLQCVALNENLQKHKKEFVGKCKRFKKEIKEKIALVKGMDLSGDASKWQTFASSLRSIIRFYRHNLKNGTLSILKTMQTNITNLTLPQNEFA